MNTPKNPSAVALGRLGGQAGRGPSKARTSEQARRAVLVRWQKHRELSPYEQWMVRSNLEYVAAEGLDTVCARLEQNGYPRIAKAVRQHHNTNQ